VEGGGAVASAFLRDDLVDRLVLHTGAGTLGHEAVDAPFTHHSLPLGFRQSRQAAHGDDILREYERHR
jgi:diaminohydroxyphosphoribosylaminopyrimidine deaminase / 5-amino-6-(5-phosphoribosylamino)uracil reductase